MGPDLEVPTYPADILSPLIMLKPLLSPTWPQNRRVELEIIQTSIHTIAVP